MRIFSAAAFKRTFCPNMGRFYDSLMKFLALQFTQADTMVSFALSPQILRHVFCDCLGDLYSILSTAFRSRP